MAGEVDYVLLRNFISEENIGMVANAFRMGMGVPLNVLEV